MENRTKVDLELAGVPLDTLVASSDDRWRVHRLADTRDGLLLFAPPSDGKFLVWRPEDANNSLLLAFVRLCRAKQPGKAIAKFAHKWGPLYLCTEHGYPSSHRPARLIPTGARSDTCPNADPPVESIQDWYAWSVIFDAMLRILAAVTEDMPVRNEDWESVGVLYPDWAKPPTSINIPGSGRQHHRRQVQPWELQRGVEGTIGEIRVAVFRSERAAFTFAVSQLLTLGDVRPVMRWYPTRPAITVRGETLFGNLAWQLALLSTHQSGVKLCAYGDRGPHYYAPPPRERATTAHCPAHKTAHETAMKRKARAAAKTRTT